MASFDNLPESMMIFGCGYVGTALAIHSMAAGVRIGALTRNPEKAQKLRKLGVAEVIVADLDDYAWHDAISGSYASVVNCVSSAGGGIEGYRKSYLNGQAAILKWAATQSIQRYVYTSSTSVYPQDGGVDINEAADTTAAPPTGRVILESEQLIAEAASYLQKWYVLRLAGIYGPGRHYLLDLLRDGTEVIPGSGDYTLNLIHLEDIVSAVCAAMTSDGPSGIYNIADDQPSSKGEMVNWLAEELGMDVPVFDPSNVSPRLVRRGGRMPDRKILNAKAKRWLDWSPQYSSFRDGYCALI
ncbi:MAG: NAD-dependent epimerase/dehydratase family protein [Lentimonas sp.]